MMVETILESSQDFGMSNGALPQWKRELLQRRAARSRPAAPPAAPPLPPPPPPPPPAEEDEELRYGPGIVKRLKSRYLSLALRDAPRRRPSVLRRAASLEHLLDERPPPAPAPRLHTHSRPPRPVSLATPPAALAPPTAQRRDFVKRARSVDALSRLDSRDDPPPLSSPPPPLLAPRPPPQPRAARPPRRPTPLLRDTERPPPDVVRSTLRKFESAPTRRAAPAARVSAVLRGLEGPQRTSTPESRDGLEIPPPASPRTPSPSPDPPPAPEPAPPHQIAPPSIDEPEGAGARLVTRAALEGIARAGSTVRYAFEAPRAGSHLPPVAAANPVLLGRSRQIGVIRPMPARIANDAITPMIDDIAGKSPEPAPAARFASPSPPPPAEVELAPPGRTERKEPPPAAVVEPVPRTPPEPAVPAVPAVLADRDPSPEPEVKLETKTDEIITQLMNGHAAPERPVVAEIRSASVISKIGAASIERAWSGSGERKPAEAKQGREGAGGAAAAAAPWALGAGSPALARRPRAPAPASTSVVFNFSNRKEVPDYIENDGIVRRASRRNRIKAGEAGVVVLRPEALARGDSDSEPEPEAECGPPSPCSVRFVNDNVLINGRSSMPGRPDRDRIAKLKLQFDDSLTRTFEYPSETSLCEESPPGAAPPRAPARGVAAARDSRRQHTHSVRGAEQLHAQQDRQRRVPAGRHPPRRARPRPRPRARARPRAARRTRHACGVRGERRGGGGGGGGGRLRGRRGALVERGAHARHGPAVLAARSFKSHRFEEKALRARVTRKVDASVELPPAPRPPPAPTRSALDTRPREDR